MGVTRVNSFRSDLFAKEEGWPGLQSHRLVRIV
jgi:hypothetical protein